MSEPLIAEDLALLLLNDESGRMKGQFSEVAIAGAVLTDLALRGRIRLTEQGERNVRKNRVVIVDDAATDDPILDAALAKLAGPTARYQQSAVRALRRQAKPAVLQRLVERGLVTEREHRLLGLVPLKSYPALDRSHEDGLRRRLFAVLVQQEEPTIRDACLIAMLAALNLTAKVVAEDVSTVDKRAIQRRAKEMRKLHWAAEAAYRVIQSDQAAAAGAAG